MTQDELKQRLNTDADHMPLPLELKHRTLNAVTGKETIVVKRRIPTVIAVALIIAALCSVALAAVSSAGLLDFVGRGANIYVPNNASDYVATGLSAAENEWFTVNVKEGYFDGRSLRLAVDVIPKAKDTLLLGESYDREVMWQDLIHADKTQMDLADTRTIGQMYPQYKRAYNLNLHLTPVGGLGGSGDCTLDPETGILTLYIQEVYNEDMESLDVTLNTLAYCCWDNGAEITDYSQRMELEQTFKLTIHENAVRHDFESREPVMFEQVGVRVDKLRIEQRSMEIYAWIEYTVVDSEAYAKTDGGLWFEFIDPESTADTPHEQRISDGPTGFGEVHGLNDTTFVQSDSLGMNELHSVYTLRAYECWEKQRFDTHEIPVYEVVKEQ